MRNKSDWEPRSPGSFCVAFDTFFFPFVGREIVSSCSSTIGVFKENKQSH